MKKILSILFAVVLVVSLGLVTAAPVLAGTTIHVPGDYPTIQQGIDAAGPGDIVTVAAGTYAAFQVIGKNNIHIVGAEGATVATTNLYTALPVVGNTWVLAAVYDSEDINIEGISFDGTGVTGKPVVVGIAYVDSTGRIVDLTVENVIATELGAGVAIIGYAGTSLVNLSGVAIENSIVGIAILNAEANLGGCTITETSKGIQIGWPLDGFGPSTVTIQGSTISNNAGIGIWVCDDSTLEAHFNNIVGNGFGVRNDGGETVDAIHNWWGDPSGPHHETLNPGGDGDEVSDDVNFEPWLGIRTVTKTVTNATVDAKVEADAEVEVKGTATVTIGTYGYNPGGPAPTDFALLGKYFNVYVPDTTKVTEIQIRLYYTDDEVAAADVSEESLRLFRWDGNEWQPFSETGVDTDAIGKYSGYIWAETAATTTLSLGDSQENLIVDGGGEEPGTPPPPPICCTSAVAAASGTNAAQKLNILREFRDEVMLPNALSAKLVSFYYRSSPPIASFISQHDVLTRLVRLGFFDPIVKILKWSHDLWSQRG